MKTIYKCISGLLLSGLFAAVAITPASAQRGGSGGGFHGGGGGGSFHGGGFSGASRPASGFSGSNGIARSSTGSVSRGTLAYRGGTGYFGGAGYIGGSYYRPGFGYYGYPHLGFYLDVLPFGYYPFYWGSSLYYYDAGVFYSPYDNGGYQVTTPPVGAAVPALPKSAEPIKIDGVQYYELNGVYYKMVVDDAGKTQYVVAGKDGELNTDPSATDPNASVAMPKVGDMVNQLPDNCRKVLLNGKKYYVSPNGIYYEKVKDPNGNTAYKITSLPDDNEKGA